jgi:hypothetical protein
MRAAAGLFVVAVALLLLVLVARPWSPKPYHGEGTVASYLWCLGFAPAGGGVIPISAWPNGLVARGYDGVLLDGAGQVVLRTGDHISFDGTVIDVSGGDTACTNTRIVTVERFERGPAPSD